MMDNVNVGIVGNGFVGNAVYQNLRDKVKTKIETKDVKTIYKRIRMNAYSFPEHVTISPEAKQLMVLLSG